MTEPNPRAWLAMLCRIREEAENVGASMTAYLVAMAVEEVCSLLNGQVSPPAETPAPTILPFQQKLEQS
jgi:hypothetical protein